MNIQNHPCQVRRRQRPNFPLIRSLQGQLTTVISEATCILIRNQAILATKLRDFLQIWVYKAFDTVTMIESPWRSN